MVPTPGPSDRKLHTPLGRLARMSMLELEETPVQVGESVRS
jgi:hypothetical protein